MTKTLWKNCRKNAEKMDARIRFEFFDKSESVFINSFPMVFYRFLTVINRFSTGVKKDLMENFNEK